jgi:hypothetical protein
VENTAPAGLAEYHGNRGSVTPDKVMGVRRKSIDKGVRHKTNDKKNKKYKTRKRNKK